MPNHKKISKADKAYEINVQKEGKKEDQKQSKFYSIASKMSLPVKRFYITENS